MKKAIYYLVDVFSENKFGGNQLAIFPDASVLDENLLPSIARELNLSETVFLYPEENKARPMRIFTPARELPTAGHPTIGTAFYLSRETAHAMEGTLSITFKQKIGEIKAMVDFQDNLPAFSSMLQPLPEFMDVYENRDEIAALIGLSSRQLMDKPVERVSCGIPYLIIPVADLKSVQSIRFRHDIWDQIKDQFKGAFVYAFCAQGEEPGSHIHGRMFAPELGIMEDAATGSANGPVGAYCIKHGLTGNRIVSEQGYEMMRKSKIYIDISQDSNGDISEVRVGGKCAFVGKGEIFLN